MDTSTGFATAAGVVASASAPVGLQGIRALLEGFRVADRSAASDEDRLVWVDEIREIERRVTALRAVLVAEADEAGSAIRARHTRLEDWMTRSGQETPREASGMLWAARGLERRPVVRDAAAAGRISLVQAKAISEALDALPTSLDPSQRAAAEQLILTEAEHAPAEKLRTMTEKIVRQIAPEQADTPEERAAKLAERDLRAQCRRKLWFGPETDGSIEFNGSLPVVAGRRLQNMVQAVADRHYRSAKDTHNQSALQETPQQRAADALVEILNAAETVENGQTSTTSIPAGAAQLHVLIPYQDLLDRTTASGLLTDGTPLSAGELRLLACNADLIPVVLGSDSQVLDVGHTMRLAPPALRRAIGLRDGGCAFPGCTTPLRHCDLHHIKPWQHGGPTTRDNLVALCRVHHTLCEPRPPTTNPNDQPPTTSTNGRPPTTPADGRSPTGDRPPTTRTDGRSPTTNPDDRPPTTSTEGRSPTTNADGSPVTPDGWEVRIDHRGLPEFIPPAALDPTRTPIPRQGHIATLFDHDQPRRAG